MLYRPATTADIPAMARLRAEGWGDYDYWVPRVTAYMSGENDPRMALKPRTLFVAECEANVVGFIAGHLTRRHECDGELEWINVAATDRGQGIADELLRRLAEWFTAQGAAKICVDVDPANVRARAFYARNGAEDLRPHWMYWRDIAKIRSDAETP